MGSCLSKDSNTGDGVRNKPSGDGNDVVSIQTPGTNQPRYTADPVNSRSSELNGPGDSNQKGISHHAIQVALSQGM